MFILRAIHTFLTELMPRIIGDGYCSAISAGILCGFNETTLSLFLMAFYKDL